MPTCVCSSARVATTIRRGLDVSGCTWPASTTNRTRTVRCGARIPCWRRWPNTYWRWRTASRARTKCRLQATEQAAEETNGTHVLIVRTPPIGGTYTRGTRPFIVKRSPSSASFVTSSLTGPITAKNTLVACIGIRNRIQKQNKKQAKPNLVPVSLSLSLLCLISFIS